MLKSCKYCGRIHDSRMKCKHRVLGIKKPTPKDRFRSSSEWQKKRDEIQERDHHLCQLCVRGLYGATRRYVYAGTSVHHIDSLEENWDRRLDEGNLITLCGMHHEMAEAKKIRKGELFAIVREQSIPPGGKIPKKIVRATPTAPSDF